MRHSLSCLVVFIATAPAVRADVFRASFANVHDRIWAGPELWANPMEDWRVQDGRLECITAGPNRNVQALTCEVNKELGDLTMSVRLGRIDDGKAEGSAGFRVGIQDEIDDYRARLIYGQGVNAGVTTAGDLFIGKTRKAGVVPVKFLRQGIELRLHAAPGGGARQDPVLTLSAHDLRGNELGAVRSVEVGHEQLYGNVALVNNHFGGPGKGAKKKAAEPAGARFWFDDWQIKGSRLTVRSDRAFGPVLWSMHTLSRGVLKMIAHLPPVGDKESQEVTLEIRAGDAWKQVAVAKIEPNSRTAQFRVPGWNDKQDVPYRLAYLMKGKQGHGTLFHYQGTVRKDPVHKDTLVVAAFTGNADYGFPNREIVRNLRHQDPDLLFFSGDNIYEYVGGYPLIRTPPDRAILNYLRKWYLVGLAFGDLMRDRPSVAIPDDHDVYQGNIWGNGGNPISLAEHDRGGYVQHPDMVNVVHRTQTGNLPDPFDTTPIKQNISVYYCDMVYGRVGFAVIADRMFKSGPKGNVSTWEGRPDHVKDPKIDVKSLDKPGLHLLGDRQEKFLKEWAADWRGVDMKCVLSQTNFCNVANYHGPKEEYLIADLDSGSWPQTPRNRAVDLMRRGFALHLCGDQHLATIVHYGIDEPADGNVSFCVPSIANFYPRRWQPDKEGVPVKNRVNKDLTNTGDYLDGLKNHVRVMAVGNPEDKYRPGRLAGLHDKASGYGIVRFNRKDRTITMECWRLLVDVANPKPGDLFPGWPKKIVMTDNYGRKPVGHLPTLDIKGMAESNGEIVYTLRIAGTRFRPMVFAPGRYTVLVGEPGTSRMHELRGLESSERKRMIVVSFR
jgi:alkaline phosphatase D